ncbi:ATP-binding protein [Tumebacillus lipolyticus]|uniref:ATP-binding protein n=1 Tax=Tumebacillus lipolyticus TaxID=1280370 RepID=A0ABW5A4J6_9BACL
MENVKALLEREMAARSSTSLAGRPGGSAAKQYECETCKDETGYFVDGIDSYGKSVFVWRECSCAQWRIARRLLKSSHMSEELQQLAFANFVKDGRPEAVVGAYECAFDYYRTFDQRRSNRQNGIAMLGVPGVGKTHLLAAIANSLVKKKGIHVHYFPHVEGFEDIRSDLDKAEEKMRIMKQADVLWWDDLFKGRETPTPYQLDCIFNVLNHRYLHNLPIMVSSERDIDTICSMDMGIGSRIYEMTRDHIAILMPTDKVGVKELNYRLRGA